MGLSNVIDIWMKRFSETGQFLNRLYMELVKYDKVKIISDLIKFASFAEKSQTYIWTYIDYGIRVPIYRTLQWLSISLPNDIKLTSDFLDELSIHILKEYTLMWSMILDFLCNYYENNEDELIKYFRDELGLDITRDMDSNKKIPAIEDLKKRC